MKSAKRQFLVKIDGLEGFWAQKSGGEIKADTTKVFDGGANQPDVIASPASTDDVVCTRPYDPLRDQPVINLLKPQVGIWRTTVSVTPTESDLTVAKVAGDVYSNALLTGIKPPEPDASSGDGAELELTFAVGSVG